MHSSPGLDLLRDRSRFPLVESKKLGNLGFTSLSLSQVVVCELLGVEVKLSFDVDESWALSEVQVLQKDSLAWLAWVVLGNRRGIVLGEDRACQFGQKLRFRSHLSFGQLLVSLNLL